MRWIGRSTYPNGLGVQARLSAGLYVGRATRACTPGYVGRATRLAPITGPRALQRDRTMRCSAPNPRCGDGAFHQAQAQAAQPPERARVALMAQLEIRA